jgi:hypothetical protein
MVDVDVYCSHVPALADLFLKWRKTPGERRGPGLQTPLGPRAEAGISTPKMNLPLQVAQCTIPIWGDVQVDSPITPLAAVEYAAIEYVALPV